MLILTLLDTGLRLSELTTMKVGDVDMQTGIFKTMGKGRKERLCRLSPATLKALSRYTRFRQGAAGEPLWCGKYGPLTRSGICEVIQKIGERSGVHAHPHKFRRTCALMLLRNGADIFSVQYLLGHSDLTVLKRYLAQTQTDHLASHERHSPVQSVLGNVRLGR